METINFYPTKKQHKAFEYLTKHPQVTSVLYGGAASGGKSFLAAAWITLSALKYPGTRWFVGRETLQSIKESILKTFIDLLKKWKINYKINNSDYVITFENGSTVMFRPLAQLPGDKDFDSLGSLELTGAFVEECSQISKKAVEILTSRIRYRLDEYRLAPKILLATNPSKGWLYSDYYMPWQNNILPEHKVFIQALWSDNPHTQSTYVQSLQRLDEQNRKRLLEGSWDYDDSDQDIFPWQLLNDCFDKIQPKSPIATHITVDPAHLGEDKTVIVIWYGYYVEDIIVLEKSDTTNTANVIKEQMKKHNIREHQIAIDIDGVGAGVKDQVSAFCQGIHNGGAVFRSENYRNLKTQMYYKFAEMLNSVSFAPHLKQYRDKIIQEVYNHKRVNIDSDGKLEMTKKENVKKAIGRSPDFSDALAFRFFWPCKNKWDI